MPDDKTLLDYLKWVSADLDDTRKRLRELEQAQREPIAIVGMSCRFPGGVGSPDDLWRLVETGSDAIIGFPVDRGWDIDEMARSVPVREGGFLAGADLFDAGFFGISPREATAMDPQQRLLLEGAWEALETAGIDPLSLRGTRTGVFVGSNSQDHVIVLSSTAADVAGYGLTGATASVLSGRVSYFLGLEGPALTVDTACSSSLVSLHLAVQSLRRGECSMALAGGVALMATPAIFIESSSQGALAPDGRCKAYAEGADGTGWGEGVGWVLVQRMSDAVREGREIFAVVAGTAVNQDGASNGLTAPSGLAQQRVIQAALDDAGLGAAQVDAVEGHGTGTSLGDPIELGALLQTYGREHTAGRPLWLGSLKSNIGHTQAAAGIGGIIKMVQAIRHGMLPGTLHAEQRTSRVEWEQGGLALLTEPTRWPQTGAPRRAGVSSFGISGTNAHVILEQAPAPVPAGQEAQTSRSPGLLPWVISGRTEEALRGQARRLLTHVEDNPHLAALDVAYSLATARGPHEHRAVVLGAERSDLLRGLADLATGEPSASVVEGVAHFGDKVVFVFPGYGSQWRGMALELLEREPAFRDEFLACEQGFAQWLDWSLADALRGEPGLPDTEGFEPIHILLFAVMVSLAALWRWYGLEPSGVIGHSQGEIAAAYVAGAISREDATRLAFGRARLMRQRLEGHGGMVAVQLSADELRTSLEPYGDRLALAAINGPSAVVMSGEAAALDELAGQLADEGVRVRKLPLAVAAHSAHVAPLHGEIEALLASLQPTSSGVPFFSTVTGDRMDTAGLDAGYWYRNLRQTVLFEQATRTALAQGYRLMLEVSAHPVVAMAVQDIIDDAGVAAVPLSTLRRGEGGSDRFLLALAQAHVQGAPVNLAALFEGTGARRVPLPTYAFQHERFRLEPVSRAGNASSLGLTPHGHPLINAAITLPDSGGLLLTGRLSRRTHPWLADHNVLGAALLPGTAYLELAFSAGGHVGCDTVQELILQAPLTMPEHDGVALQVLVGSPQDDGRRSVAVYSRPDIPGSAAAEWTRRATGLLGHGPATAVGNLTPWPPPAATAVDIDGLYGRLAAAGYGYGPAFQGLRAVWSHGDDIYAEVALPGEAAAEAGRFGLHPALLDAAFHALIAARPQDGRVPQMLFSWAGARLLGAGASALRIRLRPHADGTISLLAVDVGGAPVATADSLIMREVTAASLTPDTARELFRVELRGLVRAPLGRTVDAVAQSSSALAQRLGGLEPPERARTLVELVQSEAAVVLGFADARSVSATRAFRDLGFASMTAVELRNRLKAVTGLPLPATVAFDYPSAAALGAHLGALLLGDAPGAAPRSLAVRTAADEPIAIIGMSCRFPGDVRSPDDLWRLVADGIDATAGLPSNRGWNLDSFYDPGRGQPGRSYVRRGGFVHDADRFDAGFFGINPREALAMDPQQRLLLETAWEGLEHAGLDPAGLRGSDTGVFVGSNGQDHALVLSGATGELSGYRLTGASASIMSGRVSYEFGFEGPALTVDTACSSSLVSLHLAAQALRGGECSLALAGGCSIICTPTQFVEFSMQNALSPDGRSRAFSADGNGFGLAEGVGWLVLETLSDAHRNGHRVLAVVRGSAVNQDGASNGLTAPNGPSQERVILHALSVAGLTPAEVDAVEGHGTGTPLGDPIEVNALLNTYGRERAQHPLMLGSLKSNFGHAQAAAGVGGVIKSVMALRTGVLPPTLHADEPTPEVDWSSGGVELLTERRDWPRTGRPRRIGVSGFGISGTNAHVILEQAPEMPAAEQPSPAGDGLVIWTLSAKSLDALRSQAARLRSFVEDHPELSMLDIGRSLAQSRTVFDHRAAVVGRTRAELLQGLAALADGQPAASLVEGRAVTGAGVVFVFPGQGAQWTGMAAELLDSSEVFAKEFTACAVALSQWIDWSPIDLLRETDGALLDRVDVVQPVLWAVMVSLAALWRSYGVDPSAVIGHSQGEIAAACAIGALSRDDAAKIIALRSRALVRIAGRGGMMSVQLGRDDLEPRILPWGGRVSVAAVNSPRTVVVSGEVEALNELHAVLVADGVTARLIPVDYAAHSAQVDLIRDELGDVLATVGSTAATLPFFSCVEGERRRTDDLDAAYWHRNLREAVLFEDSIRAALAQGHRLVLEASPHPVLVMAVQDVADQSGIDARIWGTLRRNEGGMDRFLLSLAQAYVSGAQVNFGLLFKGARLVDLPTYAFQGERFWTDLAAPAGDVSSLGLVATGHPMLAAEVPLPGSGGLLLTGRLSVYDQTWLGDHVVSGMTIVPGTAFMEMAFRAAERVGCPCVEELAVQAPLLLDADIPTALQVVIAAPLDTGQRQLTVYARPEPTGEGLDEDWTLHATGWLTTTTPAAPDAADLLAWPPPDAEPFPAEECYRQLVAAGYGFGPTFQGLREVWARGQDVFAQVSIPAAASADAAVFGLHPALFDAMFHSLISVRPPGGRVLRLPFSWTGVQLHAEGATTMRVKMTLTGDNTLSLVAVDESGGLVVSVGTLLLREVSGKGTPPTSGRRHRSLFRLDWAPLALPASVPGDGRWAVLGDSPVTVSLTRHDSSAQRYDDWPSLAAVERVPDFVVLPVDTLSGALAGTDAPGAVRRLLTRVTDLVQAWLADERFADSLLMVVTHQAVQVNGSEPIDIVHSPLWGLLRSAQSENPDRLLLIDIDDDDRSLAALPRVVAAAVAADEYQVAVRVGEISVARLGLVPATGAEQAPALDPDGTVLITGASGLLAGHLARHLAARGVRNLLLLSRRGERARTTAPLVADLAALGTRATVAACDTADRAALAAVLTAIPAEHPLTGVVHAAGSLRDGTIAALTPDQLDVVLRPKVDSVWNLHELTADADLALFAMFSSAAGTLGGSGQGAYAASNAFLDTLAAHRRALGLPATSLAWGAWEASTDPDNAGMAGHLETVDANRARRGGLLPFTFEQGMALFDTAVSLREAFVLPMRMDLAGIRASGAPVPSLLRALVTAPARRAADAAPVSASLRDRLGELSGEEREKYAIELVRGQAAAVLGHVCAQLVPADEAFRDLGFDSLTAVELRNRLKAATGLTLPATLVFDHPSPRALAGFLLAELVPQSPGPGLPAKAELDRLEAALAAASPQGSTKDDDAVAERLRKILSSWLRNRAAAEPATVPEASTDLSTATTDQILAYIDNELGRSRA